MPFHLSSIFKKHSSSKSSHGAADGSIVMG